jgi:hypothetical protein
MSEQKVVHPIHAKDGEVVDIHWRLADGKTFLERRTCPPQAYRDSRPEDIVKAGWPEAQGKGTTSLDATGPDVSGGLGKATSETVAPDKLKP